MRSQVGDAAERVASIVALLIAVTVASATVRYSSFIPWGTDSGAYVTAAHDWARADLFHPQTFVFRFPWASDRYVETPLGHRPGETKGTYTSHYPLGYPLLLAAALKIGGELAPYIVAPLCAGLLSWCAFLLARALSSGWAGVMAAALIAATPVTLTHSVMAMSDVPATAFWALTWVMSLRAGYGASIAAGACTAMAVMIRPNLAPLAIVMATCAATAQHERLARAIARVVVYSATAAVGPAVLMWSQAMLYGGPFTSGYPASLDFFFNTDRIPFNARIYPAMFVGLHTWLPFTGIAMVVVAIARARRPGVSRLPLVVTLSAIAIVAINYALYLAYLSFEDWQSLRFMLPAMLAVFVLFAGTLDQVRQLIGQYSRWVAPLAAIPMLWVVLAPRSQIRSTIFEAGLHIRLQLMGRYLREALPANAAILTYVHGGAIALATGKPIIRMDVIGADALDRIVADLKRGGFAPAFVLDHAYEFAPLAEKFKSSPLMQFDWRPRAEFATLLSVDYVDISDREVFMSGDGGVVDVVLREGREQHQPRWVGIRPPGERFLLPGFEETAAFRTLLERTYQLDLHRTATAVRVSPRDAVLWVRRYLRYRIHGCDQRVAAAKVFEQINGGGAQPLCARPAEAIFPPRDEIVDFRRELEAKHPDRWAPASVSSVDLEGEAVWLEEYLQRRIDGCPHPNASEEVRELVLGRVATSRCATP